MSWWWSSGTGTPTTTQVITNRPFVAYERGIYDPKDPFAKAVIDKQLSDRLAKRTFPHQRQTSLCGPAAFFYCVQIARPDLYEKAVRDLWQKGKTTIGNLNIDVPRQTRRPRSYFRPNGDPKILGIDWMTLGGLRGSSNIFLAYSSPDNEMAAITAEGILESWFTLAGFALKESFIIDSVHNLQLISSFVDLRDHYVVSLVDSAIIDNQRTIKPNAPNHWVV